MKRSQSVELIAALEDKPLGVALNRLAIIAKQEGHKALAQWAHYELDGYNEEIHKRSENNQVPEYRNVPVIWRDVYGRPLSLQGIQDQKLFNLLSQWTMKQGILELEGYTTKGTGITIVPEQLRFLSEMVRFPMRGGDIAREAIMGLFNKVRAEALRKLSQIKISKDQARSGEIVPIALQIKRVLYGKSDRAKLRHLLNDTLKVDSSLDAFCLDYFPHVHRQFSGGMDRNAKLNLLLLEDLEEIRHHLAYEYPQEMTDNDEE